MGNLSEIGERFSDNMRIEGNIPDMLTLALQFVKRNMAVSTKIDTQTGERIDKTTYPMVAIREILLNALIHRDYSFHTQFAPVVLQMYEDRLVLENPGGLYGRLTLDNLGQISTDTRNPFIARVMETLGYTENRYSGIPTIRQAMAEHGLPEPVFESSRGVFRVTLYNGKSDCLTDAHTALALVSPIAERILVYCRQPRTRKALEKEFGSELSIAYLMSRYVQPLVEQGKLQLTLPDKPKSKNQQYFTAR